MLHADLEARCARRIGVCALAGEEELLDADLDAGAHLYYTDVGQLLEPIGPRTKSWGCAWLRGRIRDIDRIFLRPLTCALIACATPGLRGMATAGQQSSDDEDGDFAEEYMPERPAPTSSRHPAWR